MNISVTSVASAKMAGICSIAIFRTSCFTNSRAKASGPINGALAALVSADAYCEIGGAVVMPE